MTQVLLGALSLGLLWAIMTIGVYITYRILDIAALTVEGSLPLGGAIACVLITQKVNPYLASCIALLGGCLAGLCTGLLHTKLKIPALLSGILTMIALYSINLRIMGSPNLSILRQPTVFKPLTTLGLDKNLSIIIVGVVLTAAPVFYGAWCFGILRDGAKRTSGFVDSVSGLWHHLHRSAQPLKYTTVRTPGPSWTEQRAMLEITAVRDMCAWSSR